MKRVFLFILTLGSLFMVPYSAMADETVTVTATSSDISENLDLKTVATLFGQAKDLEQFEALLNNPDSAFSNLDLNGDGEVALPPVYTYGHNFRFVLSEETILALCYTYMIWNILLFCFLCKKFTTTTNGKCITITHNIMIYSKHINLITTKF